MRASGVTPIGEPHDEVGGATELFEWASEVIRRVYGGIISPCGHGITRTAVWEPVRPVAAFAGWIALAITASRKISRVMMRIGSDAGYETARNMY